MLEDHRYGNIIHRRFHLYLCMYMYNCISLYNGHNNYYLMLNVVGKYKILKFNLHMRAFNYVYAKCSKQIHFTPKKYVIGKIIFLPMRIELVFFALLG